MRLQQFSVRRAVFMSLPSHLVGVILCSYSRSIDMQRGYCYNDYTSRVLLFSSSLRIAVVALRGAVLPFSIVVALLDSDPSPSGCWVMAASAALDLKVEMILEAGNSSCLLGLDRDGRRQKIVLYPPASVVLHAKLVAGGVYRLNPAPSKRGNSATLSYSTVVPVVTSCAGLGFPAYPAPIGVGQIDATLNETFQDIRVTVSHDFGTRDYDTQRGKVVGRLLLCDSPGDQKFELVLWGDKAGADGIKKGVTVVFYDVWIKKNTSDSRPADRMELSGSLSAFGYSFVDTLMDDVVRAFTEAKSPGRKRKLSELAGLAMAPGAGETELRAQLARFAVPGFVEVVESARGEREVDARASDAEENASGHGEPKAVASASAGEEDEEQLSPVG